MSSSFVMRTDDQEHHKVLFDWYSLDQNIHNFDVGCQCQTEEIQLICSAAKYASDRDLAYRSKCVHQQSFDIIMRDVRAHAVNVLSQCYLIYFCARWMFVV